MGTRKIGIHPHWYNFDHLFMASYEPCFLPSPELRVSLITYSSYGNTILWLNKDRNVIRNALKRLRDIVPAGPAKMQEGFKKANMQIQKVFYPNRKASSLIYTLTAGPLQPSALQETKKQFVGNSCKDVMGGDTFYACVGGKSWDHFSRQNGIPVRVM